VKQKGNQGKNFKLFTSDISHYSLQKAAMTMGMGLENVIMIRTDNKGKMIADDLEEKIVQNSKNKDDIPFMVNSTFSTTVLGSLDPISEIDPICKKYNLWHHVDACLGHGMVFIDEAFNPHKEIFKNIDSIIIDPHKITNIPIQCSILITKHKNILFENSLKADYLFMDDKVLYDPKLDTGDKSLLCGRRIDVLKMYLYWKKHGKEGIKKSIRNAVDNVKYLALLVKEHPNFELVIEPESHTCCFFYIPNRLVGKEKNDQFWEEVNKLPPKIKGEMMRRGNIMVAYQIGKLGDKKLVNFFRPAIACEKDREDMEHILNEIHHIGKDM
jgi:glutamate/tyrosine decarboxylase-like PLP-dependent enzyme